MTIASTTNEISYTAVGTASEVFSVPFYFLANGDLDVYLDGTLQTITTNYTVTGAGNLNGGNITWNGTPTASKTVRIIRITEPTQETDFKAAGPLDAEALETSLDRTAMIAQQSIRRTATSAETWDAESDRITNITDPTGAQDAATKNYVDGKTFLTSGSIAAPVDPTDDDKGLQAGSATLTYQDVLLPAHVAGDRGKILAVIDGSANYASKDFIAHPRQNFIDNGNFAVAQRGTSFTATTTPPNKDDHYLLDRWILLSDGDDRVDVTQHTTQADLDNGMFSAIRLEINNSVRKSGILQILEQRDARVLLGQTVSLGFKAKVTGSSIANVRAAILRWTSTADAVTSDVVSAWPAAGTSPTYVTNWTEEKAASLAVTTSWATLRIIENEALTNTGDNLAVFIWIDDDAITIGDFLYISDVQLEIGSIAYPFSPRSFSEELWRAQRYYVGMRDYAIQGVDL